MILINRAVMEDSIGSGNSDGGLVITQIHTPRITVKLE